MKRLWIWLAGCLFFLAIFIIAIMPTSRKPEDQKAIDAVQRTLKTPLLGDFWFCRHSFSGTYVSYRNEKAWYVAKNGIIIPMRGKAADQRT